MKAECFAGMVKDDEGKAAGALSKPGRE